MDLLVYFIFGSLILLMLILAFSWWALVIAFFATVIGFPLAIIAGILSGLLALFSKSNRTPQQSVVEQEIASLRRLGKRNSQQEAV